MMPSHCRLLFLAAGALFPFALSAQSGVAPPAGQHGDHMERRFDPAHSASFDDPKRDEWQKPEQVIDALGLRPGMKIADVGAGTGYFTVRLAQHPSAPRVYAADIESSMLEHIRTRAQKEGLNNIVTVLAKEDTPNLPEPVNLVLIVNTYHHLPARTVYFAGLLKSLTPDGRVAIIDFRPGAAGGVPAHFRFPAQQIRMEMVEAGYHVVAEHEFLPNQTFLIFSAASGAGGKRQ
jgi:ubiquinone/menaquinone biosynthesis C-methylase UbiE